MDHPRSRGVYMFLPAPHRDALGSSPLARGLPWAHESDFDTAGIIPARAGFTPMRKFSVRDFRDHPRSRGVYHTPSRSTLMVGGSSPLARGLHDP